MPYKTSPRRIIQHHRLHHATYQDWTSQNLSTNTLPHKTKEDRTTQRLCPPYHIKPYDRCSKGVLFKAPRTRLTSSLKTGSAGIFSSSAQFATIANAFFKQDSPRAPSFPGLTLRHESFLPLGSVNTRMGFVDSERISDAGICTMLTMSFTSKLYRLRRLMFALFSISVKGFPWLLFARTDSANSSASVWKGKIWHAMYAILSCMHACARWNPSITILLFSNKPTLSGGKTAPVFIAFA